jgi:hypothetical protein
VDVASWLRSHRKKQYQSAFQGNTITPRYCETASGLKDLGTSPVKHQRCSLRSQHSATILAIHDRTPAADRDVLRTRWLNHARGHLDPKDLHRVIASYPPRDGRYDGTVREIRGPRTWATARIPATTSFELAVSGWRRSRGSDPATDEVRTLAIYPRADEVIE